MHNVLEILAAEKLALAVIIVQGHWRSSETTWFDMEHASCY